MNAPEKRALKDPSKAGQLSMVSATVLQMVSGGAWPEELHNGFHDEVVKKLLDKKDPRVIAAYALHLGAYVERNYDKEAKIKLGKLIGALNRKVLE